MFLRPNRRSKDGKEHTYWSLVETVRTADGPRQKTLCYLGELNGSAQARWLKTVQVFNEQGETEPLKLFPAQVEPPPDDPQVARVLVNGVRLERMRQFGACWWGLELWRGLELDRFFEARLDEQAADVPWSRVVAVLAINRQCAPGSELLRSEVAIVDLLQLLFASGGLVLVDKVGHNQQAVETKEGKRYAIYCLKSDGPHNSAHCSLTWSWPRDGNRIPEERLECSWYGSGRIGSDEVARSCGRVQGTTRDRDAGHLRTSSGHSIARALVRQNLRNAVRERRHYKQRKGDDW
jgi:hypothetical protein